MNIRKEVNRPLSGAVIEYVCSSNDAVVTLETEGYDLICVIDGSCTFSDNGKEYEVLENSAYILSSGIRYLHTRVGSSGCFEQVILHINRDTLFGRCRHSSREQERFEAAILRGISSNVSINELADMCCLSVSTFKRRFRERYSLSPHRWFLDCRLDIAAMILHRTSVPTRHIATLCGFINVSHFIATFKRRYGITPSRVEIVD